MRNVWHRDHRREGHRRRRLVLRRSDDGEGLVSNLLGKRYQCGECEATVLVTKAGDGELQCHGKTMEIAQAKPLPSSD